jgi:predicted nucleotidyltransferase
MKHIVLEEHKTLNILSDLKKKLNEIFGYKLIEIILYGSYARNEHNEESDMDIMVLLNMNEEEIKKYHNIVLDIIVDLTTQYGVVLSIIENNVDYFYEWLDIMPFFSNVKNEGIQIYG